MEHSYAERGVIPDKVVHRIASFGPLGSDQAAKEGEPANETSPSPGLRPSPFKVRPAGRGSARKRTDLRNGPRSSLLG